MLSRPQKLRSFWSAPGIETSARLQHRKSAIHGLFVKSDWLKMQNVYSAHAQEIGFGQRSQFLMLTTSIAASGDENGFNASGEGFMYEINIQSSHRLKEFQWV